MTSLSSALPSLTGYTWRAIDPDSSAASLTALTAAADRADNNEILAVPVQRPRDLAGLDLTKIPTMSAITADGEIAGVAWLTCEESDTEITATFHGCVHPAHRRQGIGAALLRWSEAKARDLLAGQLKAIRLFIRNETLTADARKIYAKVGFDLLFIEHVMMRRLSDPLPDHPLPQGITMRGWTTELIPDFYSVYNASFAERPGFPHWSQADWLDWIAGSDDFRPEFSWLALENEQPVAFLITDVDALEKPSRAAWITQVGSHPTSRRRGLSASLLAKAMEAYRADGLEYIALMVNDNNPKAQALYHKIGLEVFRYRGKYEKRIPHQIG